MPPRSEDHSNSLWVFGYGSLCWRPGFEYGDSVIGHIKGNLLRGIVIWLGAARSLVLTKDLESFAQQVLVTTFLYFNQRVRNYGETNSELYSNDHIF